MTIRSSSADFDRDAELVGRCLDGDEAAWNELVLRYRRLVYCIPLQYGLGEEEAGDVFQEVFVALLRGLPRLRDRRSLCRWLSQTTRRITRDRIGKLKREHPVDESHLVDLPSSEFSALDRIERFEEQQLIWHALEMISERCQTILYSLYFADPPKSYEEIASLLGIPLGSIGPTRARCLDRLRAAFENLTGDVAGISSGARSTSGVKGKSARRRTGTGS